MSFGKQILSDSIFGVKVEENLKMFSNFDNFDFEIYLQIWSFIFF